MPWHRWLVAAASRLVPKTLRAEWRAEWEAELRHRETVLGRWTPASARTRFDLIRRSAGAFTDAWWLRTNSWSSFRVFRQHWRLVVPAVLALSTAFTAVVVGLAAYNALLLRLPGVTDPASLRFLEAGPVAHPSSLVPVDDYVFYRDHVAAFSGIAAVEESIEGGIIVTAGNQREQVTAGTCSANAFGVLGVVPVQGRLTFDAPGAGGTDEIVISEALWRRLGGASSLVGAAVRLGGRPVTIIGVLPAGFRGISWSYSPDFWRPIGPAPPVAPGGWGRPPVQVQMIGRLAPGVTAPQAIAEMRLASAAIGRDHPGPGNARVATLRPVSLTPPGGRGEESTVLAELLLAVLLTLAVACANVTNLLLALGASRREEMLVRVALGASRARLILPHLREGLLLGFVSGLIGYGAAYAGLARLSAVELSRGGLAPPLTLDLHPDVRVLVATLVVALLAGVATGVVPAVRAASDAFSGAINREFGFSRGRKAYVRSALVVVQMATAVLVLVGVGVSLRSLASLRHVPLEFSPVAGHLLFAELDLSRIDDSAHAGPILEVRARERLAGMPGVEAVGLASRPLGTGGNPRAVLSPAGAAGPAAGSSPTPYTLVGEHYFATVGIRVVEGRAFDSRDDVGTPEVAIVNATLAKEMWPGSTAVDRFLRVKDHGDHGGDRLVEVVGVVPDARYESVNEPQLPFLYLDLAQHPRNDVFAIVRISQTLESSSREMVRDAIAGVDPRIAADRVLILTLEDLLASSLLMPRVLVAIVVTLGVVTLLLALLGLYGTVSYTVTQRRAEIGIRVALGAGPAGVFALVLKHTGLVALTGAALGLAAGAVSLPTVSSLFYGVRPVDPGVMALVALATVAIALGTAYVVARPWIRLAAVDLLRP
jgi:putative ABC transport system permease protein